MLSFYITCGFYDFFFFYFCWIITRPEAGVMVLKTKYSNMYIPSDFFHASFPWVDNLPLQRPFTLGQSCKFHVMHKEVTSLNPESAVLDPPDADHSFSAKVSQLELYLGRV